MESTTRDLTVAARTLARQRGFLAIAIVTLALGIGSGTAIFSIIDAALLRPLPYPHPERMMNVYIENTQPDGRTIRIGPSAADVRDWAATHRPTFSHVGMSRSLVFEPVIVDGPEL